MSEYLIQGETLTNLGDKIRVLSGTEDAMTPAVMASNVDEANTEIDTQASLIVQITEALGGKAISGGSEEEWIGDGNTHIWIHLGEGRTSPVLGCCPNGTVTVDWGDGTAHDVLTGTSVTAVSWTPRHNYAAAGDYVITLTVDGAMGFYGSSTLYAGILCKRSSGDTSNYTYRNAVKKIEIGDNVTSISSYAFNSCYSLASIVIPDSVTSIGSYAFADCFSLASIVIPDSVTSISDVAFKNCYCLASIVIPASVTGIGDSSFYNCKSLEKLRFNSTTPPTVRKSNAFTSLPTACIISVPTGSLAAYTSATNYPSASTYTYIEED